ncbi:MAG TPA: LlaJI family restriction endonuclease [Bacteroidia bacterium]|nr:LlaJI family restriction endonuclease [Bacteroidia bacterium]
MKVLVEGEHYSLSLLEKIIDPRFYKTYGLEGKVSHVGYFYTKITNEIVYVLPKVFIDENKKVLFDFEKDKLAESGFYLNEHKKSNALKRLLILFYRSLQEYKKRQFDNSIIEKEESLILDSNIGNNEYTYLDIILNIVNFHKENKNTILFIEKKHRSRQHKKVSWEKTIKKTLPFVDVKNSPIYIQAINKKKVIDAEEELLSMFYSLLYHIKEEYKFNITIDRIYTIKKGKEFQRLSNKAPKILRKIKYKYFSDTLVRIHRLLEIYFNSASTAKSKNKTKEFIRVDNYHIIFEDMIDKLFSDSLPKNMQSLKNQKDGKEIDHIFKYDALLDSEEQIFYVGDSKYYKTGANIGKNSKYKQFTYAKNIIQFNIDILNNPSSTMLDRNIRYRDKITEGYNISPNFFIQGKIFEDMNFDNEMLDFPSAKKEPEISYHFENRLFDRDTLFVHYYDINFLFVLKSYSQINSMRLKEFREKYKNKFRNTLIEYLNEKYTFSEKIFEKSDELEKYVNSHFRELAGKVYCPNENKNRLIYASLEDESIDSFSKFNLC